MRRRFLQLVAACGAFLTGLFRGLPALAYDGTISGNFAGVVPAGQHWHITGDVNLTGDLIVEGLLTTVDTFTLTGNGFQVLVQNGGVVDLAGQAKSGWVRWGDVVTGWVTGDRLAVAPTSVGVFVPTVVIWQGSWAATTRPVNAADVTLVDGSVAKPEVANLTRTITMTGLRRFHLHDGAGVQTLRYFALVNCGTAGVLGDYPLHYHLNGVASYGSANTGIVVEGGKNHAYVPHGTHGITFTDCVAYNTTGVAYWWDRPLSDGDLTQDSNDMTWTHCLSIRNLNSTAEGESSRLAGFWLGAGTNVACVDSTATCVTGQYPKSGSMQRSGFHWPENTSRTSWDFRDCVAHNNAESGIFVWQNARAIVNVLEDFTAYRNGYQGVNHGSYQNRYQYRGGVLTGTGFMLHAKSAIEGPLAVEDYVSDAPLTITKHNSQNTDPTFIRRCTFPTVIYGETSNGSFMVYEDCGLVPANFTLTQIAADSIIEIKEGGVLIHRWQSGVWS